MPTMKEASRELIAEWGAQTPFVSKVTFLPSAAGTDGTLELETSGGVFQVSVQESSGRLGLAGVHAAVRRRRGAGDAHMLLVSSIGADVAAALREAGIGYLDAAGNCHLELGGGRLVAHVEGRSPSAERVGGGTLRAPGYRVLFALLVDRDLAGRTVRDVAVASGASRFTVTTMFRRLREEGVIIRIGRSGHDWVPGRRAELVDRFVDGWRDVLVPGLRIGRFRVRGEPELALARGLAALDLEWGFGGTAGGMRLVRYYRGTDIVVHVSRWSSDLLSRLEMVPDRSGPVEVLQAMGEYDLRSPVPSTAHPLLVYAELRRSSDPRARNSAKIIFGQFIEPMVQD